MSWANIARGQALEGRPPGPDLRRPNRAGPICWGPPAPSGLEGLLAMVLPGTGLLLQEAP